MGPRPITSLLAQRLLALFLAGWVLLDFPLLKSALGEPAAPATLFGLPRLPLVLFAVWALLIVLLACLMERDDADDATHATQTPQPPRDDDAH